MVERRPGDQSECVETTSERIRSGQLPRLSLKSIAGRGCLSDAGNGREGRPAPLEFQISRLTSRREADAAPAHRRLACLKGDGLIPSARAE